MSVRRIIFAITQLIIFLAYVLAINTLIASLAVLVFEWRHQNRIYPGVTVLGLDVGGLEPKEAMMKYKVVLEPQEEGGYTVYVPTLPGCVSQGETTEEAMANIREAVEVYLESVNEGGIGFPQIEVVDFEKYSFRESRVHF